MTIPVLFYRWELWPNKYITKYTQEELKNILDSLYKE